MKDAPAEPTGTTTGPAELPTNPPNGRTAGVDWAKDSRLNAQVSAFQAGGDPVISVGCPQASPSG